MPTVFEKILIQLKKTKAKNFFRMIGYRFFLSVRSDFLSEKRRKLFAGKRRRTEWRNNLFGYVSVFKDELKVREYNIYRGYYCGLCKALGKYFSQSVRLGLNYDFAFLALTMGAMSEKKTEIRQEHCVIHPLSKRPVSHDEQALSYAAHMSIMVTYFKLVDDYNDLKSLKSIFAILFYKRQLKKCKKQYAYEYNLIEKQLKELSCLEKQHCDDIDRTADCFAKILECLFTPSYLHLTESGKRALGEFGYHLGRFIYIIDALQDICEDDKHQNYNPILQKDRKEGEDIHAFCRRIKEKYCFTLTLTLDAMAKSFELIPFRRYRAILENVVYLGLRGVLDRVIEKDGQDNLPKGEYNESI